MMKAGLRLGAASVILCASFSQPARAIVINDPFGAANALALANPLTGVVSLTLGGSRCTGALVSDTTVLTAQHCTFGKDAIDMTVAFDQGNDGTPDQTIDVSAKYESDATNILLDGTDFAILTLTATAPSWATRYGLFAGDPTGMLGTMAGYGRQGLGSTGWAGNLPTQRWAAENIVDLYGGAYDNAIPGTKPGTSNIINTDFDNPDGTSNSMSGAGSSVTMLTREGTTAPGDSGGAFLVAFGGSYYVSGVLSGGTTSDSVYGDISWWTGVAPFRTVIEGYGGVFYSVPEPTSMILLGVGLVGLFAVRRRREQ